MMATGSPWMSPITRGLFLGFAISFLVPTAWRSFNSATGVEQLFFLYADTPSGVLPTKNEKGG
jgi:hypothetical protein